MAGVVNIYVYAVVEGVDVNRYFRLTGISLFVLGKL
jgi:hypothetical protein